MSCLKATRWCIGPTLPDRSRHGPAKNRISETSRELATLLELLTHQLMRVPQALALTGMMTVRIPEE